VKRVPKLETKSEAGENEYICGRR